MNVETALRQMPKAELHLHLEGAVDAATFASLAAKHSLELPPHDEVADLYLGPTLTVRMRSRFPRPGG